MNIVLSIKVLFERYIFLLSAATTPKLTENKSALWIIDEKNSPGGYPIENLVVEVSKDMNLDIVKFDSKFNLIIILYNFFLNLPLILKLRSINKFTEAVVISQLNKNKNVEYIITGSCNSFIASVIHSSDISIKIIEIQHGQIDESYFPVKADIFYSRSQQSSNLLNKFYPKADIRNISNEYDIPKNNKKFLSSQHEIKKIYFWSKNPNGGISWKELVKLENDMFNLSAKLDVNLSFNAHPRDNKFKFIVRHLLFNIKKDAKFITILKIIFANSFINHTIKTDKESKILHISCFSTSLISEPRSGDYVLNICNERPQIVFEVYSWLSNINIDNLKDFSFPLEVNEIK